MKIKNSNSMVGLMFVVTLFCAVPFGSAQMAQDVAVVAGETSTADMSYADVQASSNLGAIISEISNHFLRSVKDAVGNVLWKNEQFGTVQDFTLYAFPVDVVPNFERMTDLGVYETSEQVDVRGVNSTWTTHLVETNLGSVQTLKNQNQIMTFDDGTTIMVTSGDPTSGVVYGEVNGVVQDIATVGCDEFCPTNEEVLSYFGGSAVTVRIRSYYNVSGETGYLYIFEIDNLFKYFVEPDNTLPFSFDENAEFVQGYSTDANAGQVLSILPANSSYDIFGFI